MKKHAEKNPLNTYYPLGKLPQADLVHLLAKHKQVSDPRIIFGPGLGRDAAVIDFGDRYLVTKSDPITFATDQIGWYAVNINANDIACLGAQPKWLLATVLLPEGKTNYTLVESIFQQLHDASAELGISVIGGHTEITHSLDRTIIIGTMFGDVAPADFIRSDGAQPGDALILTKRICVEGTAIIAREKNSKLQKHIGTAVLENAAEFLYKPGISVVKDAMIMRNAGQVHAMHDPTEGGIATGLYEMMEAAGYGAVVNADALPVYEETKQICKIFQLDPLGLIASGSLLAAVDVEDTNDVLHGLISNGIEATHIGYVTEQKDILLASSDGSNVKLPKFARDELTRLFE